MLNSAINSDDMLVTNKMPGTLMGNDLHFCVLYNLILRARDHPNDTIQSLKDNDYEPIPVVYAS